jgi:hypothetical protein
MCNTHSFRLIEFSKNQISSSKFESTINQLIAHRSIIELLRNNGILDLIKFNSHSEPMTKPILARSFLCNSRNFFAVIPFHASFHGKPQNSYILFKTRFQSFNIIFLVSLKPFILNEKHKIQVHRRYRRGARGTIALI